MRKRRYKRKYSSDKTLLYTDRSRIRVWTWYNDEGFRMISVGVGMWGEGLLIERPDFAILIQLEDYNDIVEFLISQKKYKVARRWFYRYIRKEFSFSGHNISEFLIPSSPYISWDKVHKVDRLEEKYE